VSALFDHTSVLKFIEWRWSLLPLTPRDASKEITNLARVLNFEHPDFSVPNLPQPVAPPPVPCGQPDSVTQALTRPDSEGDAWSGLRNSGLLDSWNLERP
jgi:phospholipase C